MPPIVAARAVARRRQIMLEEQRIRTIAGGRAVAPSKHWG
jgi:hypothetical protein